MRTALSPTQCADRLRALTARPHRFWVVPTLTGRVSDEQFALGPGGSRRLVRAVARGDIRADGTGAVLEFQLGPDRARIFITVGTILAYSLYMMLSIYRIPVLGHVLPAIAFRQGTNEFLRRASPFFALAVVALGLLFEWPQLRRRKTDLMRRIIRVIDGRVVGLDERDPTTGAA